MISPLVGLGFASAGVLLGSLPASLGTLSPRWTESFGWDAAQRDRFLRRRFLVPIVVLLPLAGWLTDLWGPKDIAIIGLLAIAIGLAAMALAPVASAASTNLLGVGFGVAFLAVGIIGWMPSALGHRDRAVEGLNLGFIAVSLGWLVGPSLAQRAVKWLGVRNTFIVAAGWSLVSAGMLIGIDGPADPGASPVVLVTDVRFWLLTLALVLYFPVESCLDLWSAPFLRELGDRRPGLLRTQLVGFWCAYLLARLATFALVRTGMEPWFLLMCAGVSAMILGNLAGAYGPASGGFGFWLVGFCYGPLLPGFLGLLAQMFPDRFGVILGLLIAIGCMYHAVLGPALDRYALSRTPREAMRMPVMLTLLLSAPLLLVTLMR